MLLAIEIGGTKLQLGLHPGPGKESTPWAQFERRRVVAADGAAGILRQIEEVVGKWRDSGVTIEAAGVGFGGPVQAGRVIVSHQIDGWRDLELEQWFAGTLGIARVRIANDCDTAALAEATHPAGRAALTSEARPSIVFYVTVGTGVGGGLVVDGELHGTAQPSAAEIGHLRPGLSAQLSGDTVESIASGWGIAATARKWLAAGPGASADGQQIVREAGRLEDVDTELLADLALRGNRLAAAAIQRGVTTLGWAIAQVITLVCPQLIVVGGGVSLMDDSLFFAPLREVVERYVFPPLAGSYRLEPAALGEEVVVQGALMLAAKL